VAAVAGGRMALGLVVGGGGKDTHVGGRWQVGRWQVGSFENGSAKRVRGSCWAFNS
jgi:hypothetical protein